MPPIRRQEKAMKMFVYQPLLLNDKYVRSTITKFPFCRIEVDDVFTTEKRPADYSQLLRQAESKVVAVRFNLVECACIVILEEKKFTSQKRLDRFVSGKSSVSRPENLDKRPGNESPS